MSIAGLPSTRLKKTPKQTPGITPKFPKFALELELTPIHTYIHMAQKPVLDDSGRIVRACVARELKHKEAGGGKAGAVVAGTRRDRCGRCVGQLPFCGSPNLAGAE